MSWSISLIGKAGKMSEAVNKQLEAIHCQEPEETIKSMAGAMIVTSVNALPETMVVKVWAYGSQSGGQNDGGTPRYINNLSVNVEPLYGFVE